MDAVLDTLAEATAGNARPAEADDTVAGAPARYVAAPGSTAEAAAVLRAAAAHGLRVVARGNGTKLDWGSAPAGVELIVDTGRLDRIVEHAAGDLVVVVQAGVGLDQLDERLAGASQQLALDPPVPGGTVGGTVSTALTGPRRLLYGAPRDLILGVTLVRADGVVAHSGGKVVKNVAGYDLGKLVTGAYGTLGLITEAAFRLHPVPPARAFVSLPVPDAAAAGAAVQRVLGGQLVPTAVELDRPAGAPPTVTVLVEGTGTGVDDRAAAAASLLGLGATASGEPPAGWGTLPGEPGGTLVKLTTEIAGLPRLLDAVDRAASGVAGVAVRGSAGVGVLYLALPATVQPATAASVVDALRRAATGYSGSVVVLTAPPAVRAAVDPWGPVPGLNLMRRIKGEFDPAALLAPGRFVGGI